MTTIRTVFIGMGSTLLAATFIGLGLVELFDPAGLGMLATEGYAEHVRLPLAVLEICGGCLLLLPGIAWYAAAFLGLLLAGALGMHLWHGQVQQLLACALLFAGVTIFGYIRHPRTFALTRLRAVADAVADREMAQARRRLASPRRRSKVLTATTARTRPAGRTAAATNSAARSSEA
jgi:uncharacterized membrane protein YphA (DoxX/SURF4 family)